MALASLTRGPEEQQIQFNIRTSSAEKRRIEEAGQALARHEQIVLSDRDYDRFVAMMTEDSEPTRIAIDEAAEFSRGSMEGRNTVGNRTTVRVP